MIVAELIEFLKTVDQNLECRTSAGEYMSPFEIKDISIDEQEKTIYFD